MALNPVRSCLGDNGPPLIKVSADRSARRSTFTIAPARSSRCPDPTTGNLCTVPRVVVDVVPKPEILDPQGQAIVRALPRMGLHGVRDVRQGKHFELDVDDDVDAETLHRIAGELLANPVIENWTVRRL